MYFQNSSIYKKHKNLNSCEKKLQKSFFLYFKLVVLQAAPHPARDSINKYLA